MMPRPGTQALVVSRADKIYISALFASSLVRNNISPQQFGCVYNATRLAVATEQRFFFLQIISH